MNLIRPVLFSNLENISAAFTEANRPLGAENNHNQGLNFGLNTSYKISEIEKNYNHLFRKLGFNRELLALAQQVHGSNIEVINKSGIYENTDGLITKISGMSLGIQVADCAAVLVADDVNRVIGAFHAGWRGAVAGIIPKGLEKMESVGGNVSEFKVYISPCISQEMFEVGEEVAAQFPDSFVDQKKDSKPHVDLKGFIFHQMIKLGVDISNIEVSAECTMQNNRFFSYRREREKAGRMLGLITLNPN